MTDVTKTKEFSDKFKSLFVVCLPDEISNEDFTRKMLPIFKGIYINDQEGLMRFVAKIEKENKELKKRVADYRDIIISKV